MKKAIQGHWVASTITGVMVAGVGSLISQAFENPGIWTAAFVALAIILAIGTALLLDRVEREKMANAEKIPENQNHFSAIYLEDCGTAVVEDNVVKGDASILTAKRVNDLRASGNRKED